MNRKHDGNISLSVTGLFRKGETIDILVAHISPCAYD